MQVEIIDQVLAWFMEDVLARDRSKYLTKLSMTASGMTTGFNWKRMTTGIEFVCHHLQKSPDFVLLKDYLDGEVDFEGKGKFQD